MVSFHRKRHRWHVRWAFKGWSRWRRHQDALDDQSSDSDDDDEFFVPAAGAAEDHQKEVKAVYNAAAQRHEQEQEEWRKQIGQFLLFHAEARDEQGSRPLTIQGCRPSEWEWLKEECDQCSTFDLVDLNDPVVWNHIMEQYVEVQSSLLFHDDDDEGPEPTPMEGHRQRKNGSVRVFVSKSIDEFVASLESARLAPTTKVCWRFGSPGTSSTL